ncbi:MAG: hypothetical protein ACLP66_19420 [Polyangia bacterium]
MTTQTGTQTASVSYNTTATQTVSQSYNTTATQTASQSSSTTATVTATGTVWSTGYTTVATTATGTVSQTATAPAVVSYTDLTTTTQMLTGTQVLTGTATTTSYLNPVPDLGPCDPFGTSCYGLSAYCYLNSTVPCTSDSTCTSLTAGDFCRYLNINDGTGRLKGDFCPDTDSGKTCRYQAKTCTSNTDCDSGVGDYCVSGTPAQMCQKSGLWCDNAGAVCASGDTCVPATSRLMMVKNAVRRVVLEHAYDDTAVVKMGQMHTFQGDRSANSNNLFAYVKLQGTTSTRTDVKFLPRSELLKGKTGPCYSTSTGPTATCTIDYSGGGAVIAPTNAYTVNYTLLVGADSRYAIPTGDGQTYTREDCAWSSCNNLYAFPGTGTGIYEGSYYTFNYVWGQPVASGAGSVSQPAYYTTYQGKSFGSAGNYWYLMDAERTEKVNENKYGANEFTGSTWSTGAEYPLPLTGASSAQPLASSLVSATCGATNGAQWDSNVVPMVNDTGFGNNSALTPTQKALMNAARLEKASYGGFYATGNLEPVACALKDDNMNDKNHSVDGYMSVVQGRDGTACWEDHVLLVVDGLPHGPGDVAGLNDLDNPGQSIDCSAAACIYDPVANPNLSGCHCPPVNRARALAAKGINVHVIAATTDLSTRNSYAAATLNNIARAGSTDPTFINIPRYAASEDELYYWLSYEMKQALRVTVATTPASAASGSQTLQGITAGNMLFQTTVELPEWKGNLIGFAISSSAGTSTATGTATATTVTYTASVAWDAASKNAFTVVNGTPLSSVQQQYWKQRNVYFSDATGTVYKIGVDSTAGTIDGTSLSTLQGLGMGATTTETQQIVQWMLGKIDPNDNTYFGPLNPAVMGSVVNSMPIDVGAPGASTLPGGNHFWYTYVNRPELVYLGADDGMLHAFYAATGQEAFAFIPADMVPVIAKLYAQGGQRYSPNDHIYGLAGSPKVKNLCVANCSPPPTLTCSDVQGGTYQPGCPDWRTILVMGEGPGGNHPFALDITDPVESNITTLTSANLLWHVGYKQATGIPISELGETDSVPAFAFHQTADLGDNRVLMASGYPYPSGSNTTTHLIDATVFTGAAPGTTGPGATINGSGGCGQDFAVLADVAIARDNTTSANDNMLAAYVVDTWGTLHQYAPAFSPVLDHGGAPLSLTCHHPLHFSPAVVQLNRDYPNNTDNSVYLTQVTNSVLDPVTVGYSSTYPGSMLVVAKLSTIGNNPPALDPTFGSNGSIQLSTDTPGINGLCGVTTGRAPGAVDCGSGGSWMPNTARPTGTPVAVIRSDGTGFQILTTWYDPPKANWDNCPNSSTNGNSYVTLHEFLSGGTWAQLYGMQIQHQYVTGVQFVGTTLFITSGDGSAPWAPTANGGNLGQGFVSVDQVMKSLSGDRFIRTAWTERLDAD